MVKMTVLVNVVNVVKLTGLVVVLKCDEINRLSGCGHCGKMMVLVVVVNVMKVMGLVIWSVK